MLKEKNDPKRKDQLITIIQTLEKMHNDIVMLQEAYMKELLIIALLKLHLNVQLKVRMLLMRSLNKMKKNTKLPKKIKKFYLKKIIKMTCLCGI